MDVFTVSIKFYGYIVEHSFSAIALNANFNQVLAPVTPLKDLMFLYVKKLLTFPLLFVHTSETNLSRLLCAPWSDSVHKEVNKLLK